jgi:hypothetical protein
MSTNKIHAPAVSVAIQGVAYGGLGEEARPVTPATPLPTYGPGGLITVSASFTRPADATVYATGDLVANSATAGSVTPVELVGATRAAGEAIRIERVALRKSAPGLGNAAFRVHLFREAPIVNVGDNGPFNVSGLLALTEIEGHVGYADVTLEQAAVVGARGVGLPSTGSGITCDSGGGTGHEPSLWALVEARGAYAPVPGEVFVVTLEGARS